MAAVAMSGGDYRRNQRLGGWDSGRYEAEYGWNEYVSGVSIGGEDRGQTNLGYWDNRLLQGRVPTSLLQPMSQTKGATREREAQNAVS
jgi:hypothetical protein